MPRLPTMRVIGSHDISMSCLSWVSGRRVSVLVAIAHRPICLSGLYPVSNFVPFTRHFGSSSTVLAVTPRSARIIRPYALLAIVETRAPGGSSMNGMNLSGKPGIVQPMQMPPTLGQPPTPLIQPRLGTLHFTTGPQQPSLTMHLGEPYSVAKSPCS